MVCISVNLCPSLFQFGGCSLTLRCLLCSRAGERPLSPHLCGTWIKWKPTWLLGSTRLSDKAIKTFPILSQKTGQPQPQESINLYIMISSSLEGFFMALWTLLCGKYTSVLACQRDENKSVVNRSSADRRSLLESHSFSNKWEGWLRRPGERIYRRWRGTSVPKQWQPLLAVMFKELKTGKHSVETSLLRENKWIIVVVQLLNIWIRGCRRKCFQGNYLIWLTCQEHIFSQSICKMFTSMPHKIYLCLF